MLKVRIRQKYLKELGLYTGKIDGKEGRLTRAAYLRLQKKYFDDKREWDAEYGSKTDILLVNAHRVETYAKNFKLEEFKCECGSKHCTGYPAYLSIRLLKNLQKLRNKYGATTITSGLRCKTFNNSLVGSSPSSKHMSGKALDIYNAKTRTAAGRRQLKAYVKKLPGHNYTYSDTPGMGNAVHFEVK